jgi:hypothetical protein
MEGSISLIQLVTNASRTLLNIHSLTYSKKLLGFLALRRLDSQKSSLLPKGMEKLRMVSWQGLNLQDALVISLLHLSAIGYLKRKCEEYLWHWVVHLPSWLIVDAFYCTFNFRATEIDSTLALTQ